MATSIASFDNIASIARTSPSSEAAASLRGVDVNGLAELSPAQVRAILDMAHEVKARPERFASALSRKQMVLFFEKASLRTRLTFEVAMNTLGGNAIFVDQTTSRLGERESIADVAHNIERWMDVCVLRTFAHETVTEMARFSRIPVINALSEVEHPCQALADILTLEEHWGPLAGRRLTFAGDPNNVSHSLMLGAAHTGIHFTLACPEGYRADAALLERARQLCEQTGGSVTITHDLAAAVSGAEAIYTDTWVSMGHENETAQREAAFAPYQVNSELMQRAAPGAYFLHCLPANRNVEVTDAVLDSAASLVFDQAENRLHAQKAVLLLLLNGNTNPAPQNARQFPVRRSHRG